jgi:hypothetical protein
MFVCVGCLLLVEKEARGWAKSRVNGAVPPVFCKRVRKRLILGQLPKYSFLKSAELIERMRFTFS